jgi:hypothetical protein
MSRITKEEALDRSKKHISTLIQFEITDQWNAGWVVYGADRLADCWYVTFDPSLTSTTLGPSYLVAVSKKDGEILFSGLTGGD